MCTAIAHAHYFGRNLDLEFAYGDAVTITPQNFPLTFSHVQKLPTHYAMIGMAHAKAEYPLYYDATNEYGLSMAGLRFREHCVYHAPEPGKTNVASFELIPFVLGRCKTLEQAKELLESCIITHESYSKELPPTPLHWLIADESGCVTLESVAEGVRVYENPVGVLANNPPFPMQLWNLNNYMNVTAKQPENRFASHLALSPYSAGMGGMGLPGDFSSASRFVKAAFVKHNSLWGEQEQERVNQFFHILDSVAQIRGCVQVGEKDYEITRYSSCCNTKTGMYYYTTYNDRQIRGIGLFDVEYKGSLLLRLDLGLASRHSFYSPISS